MPDAEHVIGACSAEILFSPNPRYVMKFVICLVAAVLPALAFAQQIPVKPGLWEHQMQLKSDSGRVEIALEIARTQIALLPAEQRRTVEDTIAAQGLSVDWVNQTFRNCITAEEVASGRFSFAEAGGCENTSVRNSGATTRIDFVCAQGKGQLDLKNGTEYVGSSNMTLNFGGMLEHATATHSGHWVSLVAANVARARRRLRAAPYLSPAHGVVLPPKMAPHDPVGCASPPRRLPTRRVATLHAMPAVSLSCPALPGNPG
jgi:hypothetical protein